MSAQETPRTKRSRLYMAAIAENGHWASAQEIARSVEVAGMYFPVTRYGLRRVRIDPEGDQYRLRIRQAWDGEAVTYVCDELHASLDDVGWAIRVHTGNFIPVNV